VSFPDRSRARSLLLASLWGLIACTRTADDAAASAAVPVSVATVDRGEVSSVLELRGLLTPTPGHDVRLGALVSGRLAEVLVAEGDRVATGQLLARIEPTAFRNSQSQAEAQLSQARAQVQNADGRLERTNRAYVAGVAAGQEVDDAVAQDAAAKSALRAAQAMLSTAHNQLGRTELRAPFDGAVVHVFAAAGEPVDGSGKPIVEIADPRELELHVFVDPEHARQVLPGAKSTVRVESEPGAIFNGEVVAVAPAVDQATGAVPVRIRIANADGALKVGAVGTAEVVLGVARDVVRVPRPALVPLDVQGEGGARRLAVERISGDDKATRIPVTLGLMGKDFVQIASGLAVGDRVVVGGNYALPNGTRVVAAPASGSQEGTEAAAAATDGGT